MFYKERIEKLEAKIERLGERLEWAMIQVIKLERDDDTKLAALIDYLGIEYVETPATKGFRKKEDSDEDNQD